MFSTFRTKDDIIARMTNDEVFPTAILVLVEQPVEGREWWSIAVVLLIEIRSPSRSLLGEQTTFQV